MTWFLKLNSKFWNAFVQLRPTLRIGASIILAAPIFFSVMLNLPLLGLVTIILFILRQIYDAQATQRFDYVGLGIVLILFALMVYSMFK